MRSWLIALALLLGTVVLTVAPAQQAAACSCVSATTEEYADRADVVGVGTITAREDPADPTGSGDDATWTIDLDRVFKGSPGPRVEVASAVSGASCGWDHVQVGAAIILFATVDGDRLRSNLCDGTAQYSQETAAELATILGEPTPVTPPPSAPVDQADGEGGFPVWVYAPMAFGILLTVVLVAVFSIRGRTP